MNIIKNQECPICKNKTLTLSEKLEDVPHFGKCYLFSMHCSNCNYKQADVEAAEQKEPSKYTLEVDSKKDLNIKIVKSSEASVKIPNLKLSVTPGTASEGYISNIEGVIKRFKNVIEHEKNTTDDDEIKKKAKNLLKKIWKIELGEQKIKLIIEDPSGNSAILSNKAKVEKLK